MKTTGNKKNRTVPEGRWQKWKDLSPDERFLLWQSVFLLPVIHAGLWMPGYARFTRIVKRITPLKHEKPPLESSLSPEQIDSVVRMVSIAARHGIVKATCLRQAIMIWWLLRRRGIEGDICFGVRTSNGQLEAHAWVEIDGAVVSEKSGAYKDYQALGSGLPETRVGL